MPREKRVSYSVRCQTYRQSAYAKLFSYLKSDEIELTSEQEMMMAPAAACWMPYAHRYHQDLSEAELKQCARRARRRLYQFIFNMESDFGLEPIDFRCLLDTLEPSTEQSSNQPTRHSIQSAHQFLTLRTSAISEKVELPPSNYSDSLASSAEPVELGATNNLQNNDDIGGNGEWDDSGI